METRHGWMDDPAVSSLTVKASRCLSGRCNKLWPCSAGCFLAYKPAVADLLWEKNTVPRLISRADKLSRTGGINQCVRALVFGNQCKLNKPSITLAMYSHHQSIQVNRIRRCEEWKSITTTFIFF
jgi:hypothetical protein